MHNRALTRILAAFLALTLTSGSFSSSAEAAPNRRKAVQKALKTLSKNGLRSIPSVSKILRRLGGKRGSKSVNLRIAGSAPRVLAIPEIGAENLFFSSGSIQRLIAGTPTQNDCSGFFYGGSAGAASGMAGCRMIENAASAFSGIMEMGTSMCYMQKISRGGAGIEVIDGELGPRGLNGIFAPHPTEDKTVEVRVSGFDDGDGPGGEESIFITVFSNATNNANGAKYAHRLTFCSNGQPTTNSYEEAQVKANGEYTSQSYQAEGARMHASSIRAFLTDGGGGVAFDPAKARVVNYHSEEGSDVRWNEVEVKGSIMTTAQYEVGSYGDSPFTRRAVSAIEVEGNSLGSFKAPAGGYREFGDDDEANFTVVAEFDGGDDRYNVSASENAFTSRLNAIGTVDAPDPIAVETQSCDIDADVVLGMDFSNPAVAAIGEACEGERFDMGDGFCGGDLRQAEEAYFTHCQGGGGPGGDGPGDGGPGNE